jgi:ATP-dependent Clp protease ATP-binding subunit ClpB
MLSFDRMTIKTQEALARAQQLAGENGQQQIEPVHLLRAVVADKESTAHAVCKKIGLDPELFAEELTRRSVVCRAYPAGWGRSICLRRPTAFRSGFKGLFAVAR